MINKTKKKILVTGAAGFIGSAVAEKLVLSNYSVVGIDNLNNYYDPKLKLARLKRVNSSVSGKNFEFIQMDLSEKNKLHDIFDSNFFEYVFHLAAQAGVGYSLINPVQYLESNIIGFFNLLESIRLKGKINHLIYASSSSVYGGCKETPFDEELNVDKPLSFYAATKKSNELMAFTYSHIHKIPLTGVRLFTVYGPWGRPDMALFKFVKSILNEEPLVVFNNGKMGRDFTYIDDAVNALILLMEKPPRDEKLIKTSESLENPLYRVINIGNRKPVALMDFIAIIEKNLGRKAKINFSTLQPGDVQFTFANMQKFSNLTGFKFQTPIEVGIKNFISWYKSYFKIEKK